MKRKIATYVALLCLACAPGLWAQQATSAPNDNAELRQEVNQLKKTVSALEQKLVAQDNNVGQSSPAAQNPPVTTTTSTTEPAPANADLQTQIKDLDERVQKTELRNALNRLNWSGDIRTETSTIFGNIPTHYDGMQMQSLLVKTLWMFAPTSSGGLGFNPSSAPGMLGPLLAQGPAGAAAFAGQLKSLLNGTSGIPNANYGQYQYFTNNLTFSPNHPVPLTALGQPYYLTNGLDTLLGQFVPPGTPANQVAAAKTAALNQLMGFMQQVPGVKVNHYGANANELATNRLRLNFEAKASDNVEVSARLSMYKVFGDSTGAQVMNGQPTSLDIDGTTSSVPSGDWLRVERAYFTWKNIAGLPGNLYLSIGRRPSTDGPPLNYRLDEPRGGTPSGTLINYQFDGVTVGYHIGEKTTLRACYGLGFDSSFGNGQQLQLPADRVKGVQLLGANIDVYATEKSFVQVTIARAWNVTDGFNGLTVLPNNPLTGDPINAPVILRFTPDANVGAINLYGIVLQKTLGSFDLYASANMDSLRPNGVTTPFGGLGANPFDVPKDHNGTMFYGGVRYKVQESGRTKIGFEVNHGSKYWFNFAPAEDDIFAPKTSARGEVYESYVTHRITNHFILKGDYQRFHYKYSGSGWDVGAPELLSSSPLLGFPTYDRGTLLTVGLTARF
jgi:hypothetical protein